MSLKCQACNEEATLSCECSSNPQIFCEKCALTHLIEKNLMHPMERIVKELLCNECKQRKNTWVCTCKGIETGLCNTCLLLHINKDSYASHNLRKSAS